MTARRACLSALFRIEPSSNLHDVHPGSGLHRLVLPIVLLPVRVVGFSQVIVPGPLGSGTRRPVAARKHPQGRLWCRCCRRFVCVRVSCPRRNARQGRVRPPHRTRDLQYTQSSRRSERNWWQKEAQRRMAQPIVNDNSAKRSEATRATQSWPTYGCAPRTALAGANWRWSRQVQRPRHS